MDIEDALDALPDLYPGPGGVAGIVQEGSVVAARSWGFADLAARLPMTEAVRLPICSISKQFTCAALLAEIGDPARLDEHVARYLPRFRAGIPTVQQLCDNQSGLRDYWALTVLQGACAEQTFRREDALPLLARMKTGHFVPGSRYSYSNGNFRLLAEMLETATGEDLGTLYARHIFGPAGMETAALVPDTRHPPDGVTGYEGTLDVGFFPASNGIWWKGDAGISASLTDMLAYEAWIDATRDDPEALYAQISSPATFADGSPAPYGHGLLRGQEGGLSVTGHGGALRGFRAYRIHAQQARLSVVVMFNHQADAQSAARYLLRRALGLPDPVRVPPGEVWDGHWLCRETGLSVRIDGGTAPRLRYATSPEPLTFRQGGLEATDIRLERGQGGFVMTRRADRLIAQLEALPPSEQQTPHKEMPEGRFYSDELEAEMLLLPGAGALYVGFSGMLGQGPMELARPLAPDIWLVATRRSMDAPAPGDWTLRLERDQSGRITGAELGCWLARGIPYRRVE
ncbi:aminopeptidase [Haematobacter massiliensis]|nr:D-aminopeptidase [Haematobacter massiliensis]OWJ71232.1 aminopeptidase [Haematobacter massiliensis]OWJ84229.1 aminopeptidase [Haematobacter massiliensis]QBJ25773.1 D-aminopeptidase [Haematobacter massiliensis]